MILPAAYEQVNTMIGKTDSFVQAAEETNRELRPAESRKRDRWRDCCSRRGEQDIPTRLIGGYSDGS